MSSLFTLIINSLSDTYLFPILQSALGIFYIFSLRMGIIEARKASNGGASMRVIRGNESMGRFFGFYTAISGLFVALCLYSDFAKDHRVFWSILDTTLIAYVCLFNIWFRNKLLNWVEYLTKIDAS